MANVLGIVVMVVLAVFIIAVIVPPITNLTKLATIGNATTGLEKLRQTKEEIGQL